VQPLGEKDLLAHCARRGNRLTDAQVERLDLVVSRIRMTSR
jgi:hypothetical protein